MILIKQNQRPILSMDTVTTIKGTKSAVVCVMKIHIEVENIDWDQTSEPNPDIAMVALSQLFCFHCMIQIIPRSP